MVLSLRVEPEGGKSGLCQTPDTGKKHGNFFFAKKKEMGKKRKKKKKELSGLANSPR